MIYRTDKHNNPTAFTTEVAANAGLVLGKDYLPGDSFMADGKVYYTAKLLGDPISLTVEVLDKIGFYTKDGHIRWIYMALPQFVWNKLDTFTKVQVIRLMYHYEGGTAMNQLFDKYNAEHS